MRITIKDFSENIFVPNIEQLKTLLALDYKGRTVPVKLRSRKGKESPQMFRVSAEGEVLDLAQPAKPVRWGELAKFIK